LTHDFSDAAARDEHMQGWRYQLSLFANVVSNDIHADGTAIIDAWLAAWSQADVSDRTVTLLRIVEPGVRFRDRFSTVDGLDELDIHLDAAQRFMPGLQMKRHGDVRQCQGVALADWIVRAADDQERARVTSVFVFNSDGLIESVTGLWSQHPQRQQEDSDASAHLRCTSRHCGSPSPMVRRRTIDASLIN
jgi:hypothetical protein